MKATLRRIATFLRKPQNIILILLVISLAYLVVWPLVNIFQDTFLVHPSEVSRVKQEAGSFTTYHWTKVFADLSDIGLDSVDRIDLLISSPDASLGEPSLLVDTVSIISSEKDSSHLDALVREMKKARSNQSEAKRPIDADTVRLLVLLIICALSLEILNILLKRASREDENNGRDEHGDLGKSGE